MGYKLKGELVFVLLIHCLTKNLENKSKGVHIITMKKNCKYILLLLFILISCEKKTINNYEKIIIGEWIFETESPKRENYFYTDFSYSFDKNGTCVSKPGYFDTKEKTENIIYSGNSLVTSTVVQSSKDAENVEMLSVFIKIPL